MFPILQYSISGLEPNRKYELFIDIGIPEDYIRAKNIDFYIKKLHKKDQS